jgi:hypothetical protein
MTPEQFNQIQRALSYDNAEMARQIGKSERLVVYMKSGEKRIIPQTVQSVREALTRKIAELKILQRGIAKVR